MKRLFAIISCHKNRARRDSVRNTWLKDLTDPDTDYKFIVGRGTSELEEDVLQLDVDDSYEALPFKVREVCKWALDNGYEYLLKVDDDTYIFPNKMWTGVNGHDYVGRHNQTSSAHCIKGFCSGFSYWLSKKAMGIMVRGEPDIIHEDMWAGGWLAKHGIVALNEKRYVISILIPKSHWLDIATREACSFAEVGTDMVEFDNIVKGRIKVEKPLPATGKVYMDPRSGRKFNKLGHVVRGSRISGRRGFNG